MKPKQLRYIAISFAIIISFFLGRKSSSLKIDDTYPKSFLTDSSFFDTSKYLINDNNYLIDASSNNMVYRCGNSMIYHPTKKHASFKRCKSKVSELSVEKAKEMGMRHCKCSF